MKKFLAIYLGTPSGREKWMQIPEAKRKEREQTGVKAWMDWGVANEASIVDQGSPLGKTKRASQQGFSNVTNLMTGYTIVQAESHEAAARPNPNVSIDTIVQSPLTASVRTVSRHVREDRQCTQQPTQ